MAEPPLEAGAVHDTTDWALAIGGGGHAGGGARRRGRDGAADAAEAGPVPVALVAVTVNV